MRLYFQQVSARGSQRVLLQQVLLQRVLLQHARGPLVPLRVQPYADRHGEVRRGCLDPDRAAQFHPGVLRSHVLCDPPVVRGRQIGLCLVCCGAHAVER